MVTQDWVPNQLAGMPEKMSVYFLFDDIFLLL